MMVHLGTLWLKRDDTSPESRRNKKNTLHEAASVQVRALLDARPAELVGPKWRKGSNLTVR